MRARAAGERRAPPRTSTPHDAAALLITLLPTALRRTGAKGGGRFAPITWEQALDEIVTRWQTIIEDDGPLGILGYCYSAHQGQINRGLMLGLFHALGSTRLLAGTVCDSCAEAGWAAAGGSVGGAVPETVGRRD